LALVVLLIVSVVVGQTWHDWRKSSRDWVLPDWAKGVALGGVLAVSLAAASAFASAWLQDPGSEWGSAFESRVFWPQVGLVVFAVAVVFLMARKRSLPWMLLIGGLVLCAFWIGMALGS
jgi:hypothetical protein